MATIDRSRLRTGFDVEAVITGRYMQGLLTAAYDGGLIRSSRKLTVDDVAESAGFPLDSPDLQSAYQRRATPVPVRDDDPGERPTGRKPRGQRRGGTLAPGHELGIPNTIYVGVELVTTAADGVLSSLGLITGWVIALAAITFGPIGAGIALGVVVGTDIGAGVYLGEYFDTRVKDRADATLNDVIPDRLAVATRRWDPFYATKHQAVVETTSWSTSTRRCGPSEPTGWATTCVTIPTPARTA